MIHHNQVLLSLAIIFIHYHDATSEQQAPVVDIVNQATKIIIPDLPLKHYDYWIKNNPASLKEFEQICSQAPNPNDLKNINYFRSLHVNLSFEDPLYLNDLNHGKLILNSICGKIGSITKKCWGYERDCHDIYLMPECYGSSLGQAKNDQEQKIIWFNQADFGYILERRKELLSYCSPDKYSNDTVKSSLQCTKYFRTCRGANLLMEFTENGVSAVGEAGGWNCDLQTKRIQEENGQQGRLQSWFPELNNYQLVEGKSPEQVCDVTIEKQVFMVKIDEPTNMYHYFCNFLNLYATMHLNNKFSDDNEIIIWDKKPPRSKFEIMWSVFSKNKVKIIDQFKDRRVCFRKFIFSLLPRMVNGLYFDTPLISGCCKTGLFDAFSKHVVHKLRIPRHYNLNHHRQGANKLIRVTIVSRSTLHRKILNEVELKEAAANISTDLQVNLVDYNSNKQDFRALLEITHNTDILVAIHGVDLTYSLFLPDWAAVFELHSFSDQRYYNLARLRGLSHFTFSDLQKAVTKLPVDDEAELNKLKASKLVDHEKFSNYRIEKNEFLTVLEKAIEKVRKVRSKYFDDHDLTTEEIKIKKEDSTRPEKATNSRTEL